LKSRAGGAPGTPTVDPASANGSARDVDAAAALAVAGPLDAPGVLGSLPRRRMVDRTAGQAPPAQMRFLNFRLNRLYALRRLFTWLGVALQFVVGTAVDGLLRRDTLARRALRLRHAFERRGGCFAKLGIHLSMRVDFMPWEFSIELARMRDRMDPFPLKEAIASIERATGMPLPATFARFDPTPIDSNSVANTYQAQFHNQQEVIVKVRRPDAGETFMADLQAFDWLLLLAELLTIFRPGFTHDMRSEFRSFLIEELDFVQEARRQDAFRRAAAKSRQGFFSAPRVYLGLSGEEVVIEEFASGMWLWELVAAVEQNNEGALAQARSMNIDAELVAKRLLWVNHWSWEENLFFHADPHPDNIIVGRDSQLYFINFSATGTLNRSQRQALQQNMYYLRERDPLNMARSTLIMLEPLPAVDLIELTQELESYNWQLIYALESDPASLTWAERTSAAQWIGMIRLARKYGIVVNSQVLRLLRSTLLIESTAARLHRSVDFVEQYHQFENYRAERARRRVTDAVTDALEGNSSEATILRLERLGQTVAGLFFRTRHMLTLPSVNFNALMSKWSFAVYTLVRFAVQALVVTGLGALLTAAVTLGAGFPLEPVSTLRATLGSVAYQVVVAALVVANVRAVLFRLDDKEV
jgi:predicted unusual protein kinase regulating ubiquinone biosynthesis (AarF/ABC1/UbiB family)